LEILAQTRNPLAVQPHLRKCFDAISRLEFGIQDKPSAADAQAESPELEPEEKEPEIQYTNEILAMVSPEGESVELSKGLKARGNVEDWLGKVEESMFNSLRKLVKGAIADYERKEREQWVLDHCSQVSALPCFSLFGN
jgi:dynein heavy chain